MQFLSALVVVTCASVGADPAVSIEGGPSEDGHSYTWTVRNHGSQAITYIEFPHYNADLSNDVPGWKKEMTEQVGAGGGGDIGKLMYTAESRYGGLMPGRSETFGLRVGPAGAATKKNKVHVRYADGTKMLVPGVLCPMPESWLRRNFPMVGLGACFVLFIVMTQLRRRRGHGDGGSSNDPTPQQTP